MWRLVRGQLTGCSLLLPVAQLLQVVFLIFVPVHAYLALRADLLERDGTISSIISRGRFVRTDVTYVDQPK